MSRAEEAVRLIDDDASLLWTAESDRGHKLTCYAAGKHTVLLVEYPNGAGYEIYAPPTLSNNRQETILAAKKVLGIDEVSGDLIGLPL